MTTSDGVLSGRATPALLISVRAGSALLATPTAWLGRRPSQAIGDAARWHNSERSNELSDQMAALLPTPVVNDMGRGKTPEEWDSWTDEMKERHGNGNGHGASLEIEILRLLPTPTSVDAKVFGPNIDWEKRRTDHAPHTASVLMNLQSNDGNTSLDEQPPPQSTTED
jgi:DNA (cytosine-5)-methyltransferase 1